MLKTSSKMSFLNTDSSSTEIFTFHMARKSVQNVIFYKIRLFIRSQSFKLSTSEQNEYSNTTQLNLCLFNANYIKKKDSLSNFLNTPQNNHTCPVHLWTIKQRIFWFVRLHSEGNKAFWDALWPCADVLKLDSSLRQRSMAQSKTQSWSRARTEPGFELKLEQERNAPKEYMPGFSLV